MVTSASNSLLLRGRRIPLFEGFTPNLYSVVATRLAMRPLRKLSRPTFKAAKKDTVCLTKTTKNQAE